jgi:hypothetical protein
LPHSMVMMVAMSLRASRIRSCHLVNARTSQHVTQSTKHAGGGAVSKVLMLWVYRKGKLHLLSSLLRRTAVLISHWALLLCCLLLGYICSPGHACVVHHLQTVCIQGRSKPQDAAAVFDF